MEVVLRRSVLMVGRFPLPSRMGSALEDAGLACQNTAAAGSTGR